MIIYKPVSKKPRAVQVVLVPCRRQDIGGTQGRDGLATIDNQDLRWLITLDEGR